MIKYSFLFILTSVALLVGACTSSAPSPSVAPTATASTSPSTPATPTVASATTVQPSQPTPTSTAAPTLGMEEANFRLLISDEENVVEDFAQLLVTIDRIGLQRGGESGGSLELDVPEEDSIVDLVQVQGDNAQEILRADMPPGQYSKVFIHVDEVTGFLLSDVSNPVNIKLPSSKLQIIRPFEVKEDSITTFVYDITVVAAGNEKSGIKYLLKPVIGQSGADQPFKEVESPKEKEGELDLQLQGEPQPGAQVALIVTDSNGSPVSDVVVRLKAEGEVGMTDSGGLLTIDIPQGTTKLRLEAHLEEMEGELRVLFEEDGVDIETDDEGMVLKLEGDVLAGATSILAVTDSSGSPTPDATVRYKLERLVGTTDANGQILVDIPADATEVELEARLDDQQGELKLEF